MLTLGWIIIYSFLLAGRGRLCSTFLKQKKLSSPTYLHFPLYEHDNSSFISFKLIPRVSSLKTAFLLQRGGFDPFHKRYSRQGSWCTIANFVRVNFISENTHNIPGSEHIVSLHDNPLFRGLIMVFTSRMAALALLFQ